MSTVLIELRQGGIADVDQVERIITEAFDPRYGEAWTRNQVIGILAMPGVWMTLAEMAGTPCGFALARGIAGEAELLLIAVLPTARRRGVGSALMRCLLAECRTRKIATLHLEVRAGNDAINLYRSTGFVKIGERRDYYRGGNGQSYSALTLHRKMD
ncbi:GNAT family N-acetyltransferase [uncultured Sphingomonas sp.]|uniref:GNAT family N-acetyltransferase n=1 Tax=uncultured Sphingomonas sp. TaxID=158754 RepID=UPI0035CA26DF